MKKSVKTVAAFIAATMLGFSAQAQTTCSTSVTYTYPVTQTVTSYSNTNYWFKITTPGAGTYQLTVANGSGTGKITKATVYTGSCASLTLFGLDSLVDTTKTSFNINLVNTASTAYYINLSNSKGTAITFSLSTVRQLYILGHLTYLLGDNDTLFGATIGGSGTPSYTWQPGGAHTAQIISTATVNTTYTLTYSDGLGTLTDTATARAIQPPLMHCQLVTDGDFESMGNPFNGGGNISSIASGCNPPPAFSSTSSAPTGWVCPTCGTSDYFNTIYVSGTPVGVPVNMCTDATGLWPHSGNGYAGFMTYGYNNFREYIEGPLTCSLVTGQLYNVSYWAAHSTNSLYDDPHDNIGAYFSTSLLYAPSNWGTYIPQVNSGIITGTPNTWVQVSGTITGGGEKWITVGNFYDDDNTSCHPNATPGYYFVDDISVSPASPAITVSSCQSGSVTLAAYGAASANTSWFDGTTHYYGNPLLYLSPSSATTLTCTVTFPGCGVCPNAISHITVQPQTSCTGTAFSTPGSNGVFTASPGYAASNVTITTGISYTINCSDLRMAAGTSITIANTGTLTIQGSWIHACNECTSTSMWQGIVVNGGGTLIIQQTGTIPNFTDNIIEDAVQAVYTHSCTGRCSAPIWNISNVIFNNNTTDIYIDTDPANLSGNVIGPKAVFTCRKLSNHSVALNNFNAIISDISATTPSPLHQSTANPTDLTIAGLRTGFGIFINATNISYPINVGSIGNAANIFDNLDCGIYASKSSLTAKNNVFQNLTGNSTDFTGTGIISDASNGFTTGVKAVLIAGNSGTTIVSGETNTFTNCSVGILTNNMRQVYINNNTFNNETTAATYSTAGTYVTGGYGVLQTGFAASALSSDFEQLEFANNNVQNCANGHFLSFGNLWNKNPNSSGNNSMNIQGNTIASSPPNYCTYGLYLSQTSTSSDATMPKDALSITTNTITNVTTNAIYAQNVTNTKSAFMQIYNNGELSVKYNPALTGSSPPSPRVAAISLSGCDYARVTYNTNIRVTNFSGSAIPSAQYHGGIYVYGSTNNTINCNTVSNTGEDFVFEGTCTSATRNWQKNSMDYSKYGLVLRTSGILGDQGATTYPIDDTWGTTGHFTNQTLTVGTNPGTSSPTSKLYTQGTGVYVPTANANTGGGAAYTTGGGTPSLITISSGSSTLTCGESGTGDRTEENNNQVSSGSNAADSLYYQNIVNTLNDTSYHYPVYDAQTRWGLQYIASSLHQGITPATGYAHAKTLAAADAALANTNYSTALSLTNSFTAGNTIESNWQLVNPILIKAQSYTLTNSDISSLQSVAQQCPHSGGHIVWTARALLTAYYKKPMEYPNDCPITTGGSHRTEATAGINLITGSANQIILYPNPNNGDMIIEYSVTSDANMQITDVTCKLVGEYNLSALNNKLEIHNDNLANGVYLYRIIGNSTVLKTGKVVIMK